ncbi:rhodanese-like domain-containing protein [Bacillus sp. JJ1122]|uniref:rhodanese-like domain-containing protein n=1 Tax=Bacillus sp. JJ1122 TaxID=3122951 RepID=UPI0030007B97
MTVRRISAEELYEKVKKDNEMMLLDVRAEEKYKDYHIEETGIKNINLPKNFIFENNEGSIEALPKDKEIVVTCTTGNSATKCANILSEKDYDVVVLDGGVTAWKSFLETKSE